MQYLTLLFAVAGLATAQSTTASAASSASSATSGCGSSIDA